MAEATATRGRTGWWESLEQWSPTAFLVAGGLWLVYAGLSAIELVTEVVTPSALDVAVSGLALFIPVFGLLGVYPRLRDHAPRLSVAGAVLIVISGVSTLTLLVWLFGTTLLTPGVPAIPADAPGWTVAAFFVSLIPIALGFLLFGVAGLRTGALTKTVALLLMVPFAMWVVLLAGNAVDGNVIGVIVYVPISLAALSIGYLLRTESTPTEYTEPAPETTAR